MLVFLCCLLLLLLSGEEEGRSQRGDGSLGLADPWANDKERLANVGLDSIAPDPMSTWLLATYPVKTIVPGIGFTGSLGLCTSLSGLNLLCKAEPWDLLLQRDVLPPDRSSPGAGQMAGRGGREERVVQGELAAWPEIDLLVPVGSIITIRDVETGITFQAKRRGGHYHMDIEPVTPQDTITLKGIYGGEWSWARRAVIVQIGQRSIAGSINGMPHGQADITGNNFPGHFCLHFMGSAIHRTGEPDPEHQDMVLEAAGSLKHPTHHQW
jgi:hypothetical protein